MGNLGKIGSGLVKQHDYAEYKKVYEFQKPAYQTYCMADLK